MADAATLASVNGSPAVVLNIRRQSGTNAVQVIQAVKDRIEELRSTLPPGYAITIVRDQGDFIKASIRAVQEHLVVGALLAALVVLIFLGNWRSTVIAAIAIPTSIIATFGLIWYEGFTLNSMTMLALTLSVGIVIDDAIVVLENIYRFIEEKGQDPFKAAVEATKEIGLAVMATTLSLVAIFLPIGFMSGIIGRFMKSFGLTMAFAVMVSLLVSFTLTPMLGARWLKVRRKEGDAAHPAHTSRESAWFGPIDHGYTKALDWALSHRRAVAIIAFLVLLSSAPLFMLVNKNFLPIDDQSEFEIGLRAPEGTSLESTELIANRIATRLRKGYPEVAFTMVTVADDSARDRQRGDDLRAPGPARGAGSGRLRGVRRHPEGAEGAVRVGRAADGGAAHRGHGRRRAAERGDSVRRQRPRHREAAGVRPASGRRDTRTVPGAVDVDISLNPGKPELEVTLDRAKAADLGVQIERRRRGDAAARRRRPGHHLQRGRRAVRGAPARAAGLPPDRERTSAASRCRRRGWAACRSTTSPRSRRARPRPRSSA